MSQTCTDTMMPTASGHRTTIPQATRRPRSLSAYCLLFAIAFVICLEASTASPAVRTVPADYPTISEAVQACDHNDTVLVAPGTYSGEGNRDVIIQRSIVIRSQDGPNSCIVDCRGDDGQRYLGFRFYSSSGAGIGATLDGFTITGASGAILTWESTLHVDNCIITGNGRQGCAVIDSYESNLEVTRSIISGNSCFSSDHPYGGVCCVSGRSLFSNCVIVGNAGYRGGALYCPYEAVTLLENCIIYDNRAALGSQVLIYDVCTACACPPPGVFAMVNCCLDDDPNAVCIERWTGVVPFTYDSIRDCIRTRPAFARDGYWDPNATPEDISDDFWVDGDYHLKSQAGRWDDLERQWTTDEVTSPCIDAGDLVSPIGSEPFPNGGRVNIGAYGGTARASKSYFDAPVCRTVVAGDINGDCKVDFADMAILTVHWARQSDNDNRPPIVTIVSPEQGAEYVYTGPTGRIYFVVNASDLDGSITKMELFIDGSDAGVDIGKVAEAPDTRWDGLYWLIDVGESTYPDGLYHATVVATDDRGAVTASGPVSFTIRYDPNPR